MLTLRRFIVLVAIALLWRPSVAVAETQAPSPCEGITCEGGGGGARATSASYTGLLVHATGGGRAILVSGQQQGGCEGCIWVRVPSCPNNHAFMAGEVIYVVDVPCGGSSCAEGAGDQWWIYLYKPGWDNLRRVDIVCTTASQPLVTGEQLAAAVEAAFSEEHVPVPKLEAQPRRDVVVVNKPVISWVANHTTIDEPSFTQAFGISLALRAYPEYHWNFDVGGSAPGAKLPPTTKPGAPYPSFDVSYTYRRTADYRIQVQAQWHGEFQIPGITDWIAISGTPTVTSAPYPVSVREARAVLYDD
jgi:hypothetical protein